MSSRVLVPLAEGFEEIEALTVVDVLRRVAVDVVTAGVRAGSCKGRSGIVVSPDTTLDEALASGPFDMIVLPGGMPASATLRDDDRVTSRVAEMKADGRLVAAICAAPIALARAGVLEGETFTSYPGMDLPAEGYSEERVVVSGNVITSRGPGTAMEFAIELVRLLLGDEIASDVSGELLAR